MPYDEFKALTLDAIDASCVLEPLRGAVLAMRQDMMPPSAPLTRAPDGSLLAPGTVAGIGTCALVLGL